MTRSYAVFGSPISHSLSPRMHAAWYEHAGIDAVYAAIETRDLAAALEDLPHVVGASVTMPLKDQAFALAGHVDAPAQRTGTVNTLLRAGAAWHGFNTDAVGFADLLDAAGVTAVERATVLGAGATARSAVIALSDRAKVITVLARSRDRAVSTMACSDRCRFAPWEADSDALDADVVIATTPAGATDALHAGSGLLVEVVYSPWPTALADRWEGQVIDGLELLARQAARQVEIFFPGADSAEAYRVMLAAVREA